MSPLARCSSCRGELPDRARFCPNCGVAVAAAVGEERRIVTVVFADLVDFTGLAEARDPEAVKELLDSCFDALVPLVEGHGGHVDKIIGDELMAVFGAPQSHGDDESRAVRAALALSPAIDAMGIGLQLRVGVNTGEVLAGAVGPSAAYTVTGDVVNTAHRLVTAAEPGQVLVGETTRQATESTVAYRLVGDLELKGKHEPVRAWAARGLTGTHGAHIEPALVPLIGREAQRSDLDALVRAALTRRQPVLVTVVGEPGVGVTRLVREVAAGASVTQHNAKVLWVTCPPSGTADDGAPLAALVRSALGISSAVPDVAGRVQLEVAATDVATATGTDAGVLKERLSSLLGLSDPPSRPLAPSNGPARAGLTEHQMAAVRSVVAYLAMESPVLVVFDDVHAGAEPVLRFVSRLADSLPGQPLAVVACGRVEVLEVHPELAATEPGRAVRTIGPLTPADSTRLVAELLSRDTHGASSTRIGPGASARLVEASGGYPFVLEQLLGYLRETGALHLVEGLWLLDDTSEGAAPAIPDGVRSLLSARLDSLAPEERSLLIDASVLGARFWVEALEELSDVGDVRSVLARLDAKGLTAPAPPESEGDHRFGNVLTADVAYASLPIAERAVRHARVALWMRDQWGETDEPSQLSLLAHHFERAVVSARAVDHTDGGLGRHAFSAMVQAARMEHRRDGLRQADHWFRRALDVGTHDPTERMTATIDHGRVLLELRQLDPARSAFEQGLRMADDHPRAQATALAHLGAVARLSGDSELAREGFMAATNRWRRLGDVQGEIDTLRLEGWCELSKGRFRAALPRLEQAASLEETLEHPHRRGETLRNLGWCEYLAGDLSRAREHLWAALGLSADSGDLGTIGWCFGLLASTLLYDGRSARSLEITQELALQARRNADPWGEWMCVVLQAAAHVSLGNPELAATLAAEAEDHLAELDDPWSLALSRAVQAQAARAQGDLNEARRILVAAISSAESADLGADTRLLAELAKVELNMGSPDEAERLARSALALVRAGIGDHESGLRCLVVLAESARRAGRDGEAQLLLEEAAAERAIDDRTDAFRQAALDLAELRLDAGDDDRARGLVGWCEEAPTDDVSISHRLALLAARVGR